MKRKQFLLTLCSVLALQAAMTSFAGADEVTPRASLQHASLVLETQGVNEPPGVNSEDESVTLRTLRARAQLGLGDLGEAHRTAQAVLAEDPNNVEALRIMAAIAESKGRWRHAAMAWDRVYQVSSDPAAAARRDELLAANRSSVTLAGFFEGAVGADEQYGARASVAWRSVSGPEWDVSLENRHAEDEFAVALDGTTGPISLDRQRLDVGVADNFDFGRAGAKLIVTNDGIGGRVHASRPWAGGSIEATLGVNEPYWFFSEGIANEATIDYAQVAASHRFSKVALRGSLRSARYNVADEDNITTSVRATGAVEVALTEERNPIIVSYIVDGEYYGDMDLRTGPNGLYAPMSFVDREVHSLGVYKTFGDTQHSYINLGAGYRADRLGAEGPFASAWGEQEITDDLRIGVRFEYSTPSIRGGGDTEAYSFGEIYLRRAF